MREVYINSNFECFPTNEDGTLTAVSDDFFDGKCDTFIKGYVFVPKGCERVRPSDGKIFKGKMITPFKDSRILEAAQQQYETMMAEASAAYQEGVNSV